VLLTSHELERVITFDAARQEKLYTRTERFQGGRAFFHRDFPDVYDLNYLQVEDLSSDLEVTALADEAERIQGEAGLQHRRVQIADEATGVSLESGFRELGWEVERLLLMAHHRERDRRPPPGTATQIGLEEMKVARELSLRQEPKKKSKDEIAQLTDTARLMQEAIGARFYAAHASGEVASTCELYSDGSTAQIEAVITLEQHRNKGLGRAVVLTALDVALSEGHDFVFLIADDDDWPKEMYIKLGFDPIGRGFFNFIRSPKA